jgi:hypothetical protein
LIFNRDLEILNSFKLDDLVPRAHVFTISRGLVRGMNTGQILITKFKDYQPESTIEASNQPFDFNDSVTAITTKDDIFIAGTAEGHIGVWSYNGSKLFHFRCRSSDYVHSISIRPPRFLVATTTQFYEYELPVYDPNSRPTNPKVPIGLSSLAFPYNTTWATYDFEGKNIKWATDGVRTLRRPIIPLSKEGTIRTLSVTPRGGGDQEIYIRDILTEYLPRSSTINLGFIDYIWCDQERLFLLSCDRQETSMMDFAKDIKNFKSNISHDAIECFSFRTVLKG